jgi:hypothetical protein
MPEPRHRGTLILFAFDAGPRETCLNVTAEIYPREKLYGRGSQSLETERGPLPQGWNLSGVPSQSLDPAWSGVPSQRLEPERGSLPKSGT